jgi:hypothetical protein
MIALLEELVVRSTRLQQLPPRPDVILRSVAIPEGHMRSIEAFNAF